MVYKEVIYPNAPIIEALIDIQVRFALEPSNNKLLKLSNSFKDFESNDEITIDTAEIHPSKEGTKLYSTREKVGYKLSAPKNPYVVQIKKTGITISITNKYNSWDLFSKEAKKYWNKYNVAMKPEKVIRVGLRYINKIEVPAHTFNFEEYFHTYPHVFNENTKTKVSSFFMQLQLPQEEGGMAIVNQSPTATFKPGHSAVLLDIDVFDPILFNPKDENLWKRINLLRDQKNFIFDGSLTDRAKELFK